MNDLLGKLRLVVAGIAEARLVRGKQLGALGRVRVVAGGASHAEGGMHGLFRELRFVVAVVAQFSRICDKQFIALR